MDNIVEGAVQIGVGHNEYIGERNNSPFGVVAAIGKTTLDVDGRTIIKNGQLSLEPTSQLGRTSVH